MAMKDVENTLKQVEIKQERHCVLLEKLDEDVSEIKQDIKNLLPKKGDNVWMKRIIVAVIITALGGGGITAKELIAGEPAPQTQEQGK